MALNDVLINTLMSLSEDNLLSSWSVFQEKNGQIYVKIRFDTAKDAPNHDVVGHYRRKPAQQVRRDRERTMAWRASSCKPVVSDQAIHSDKPAQKSLPLDGHSDHGTLSPSTLKQHDGVLGSDVLG